MTRLRCCIGRSRRPRRKFYACKFSVALKYLNHTHRAALAAGPSSLNGRKKIKMEKDNKTRMKHHCPGPMGGMLFLMVSLFPEKMVVAYL